MLLLAFALGTGVGDVSAEEDFLVQTWGTDSGLWDSTVASIAQTPDGYLWVGTLHGGLARFDGVRFVNFHPGNAPELSSIQIRKLLVDAQGTLWVGTAEGALVSYREGQFRLERQNTPTPQTWLDRVISSDSNSVVLSYANGLLLRGTRVDETNIWQTLSSPEAKPVLSPCADRQGTIWYRTADHVLGRVHGNQFELVPNPSGLRNPQINTLLTDLTGQLWVGTDEDLARWDGRRFVSMTPTNGDADVPVRQMVACREGALWIWTGSEMRKCQGQKWIAHADLLESKLRPSARGLSMFADSCGGLWLANDAEGLWHVDAGGKVSRVRESQGLPSGRVECWFEDREGNVWIGLSGGGLACVRVPTFHSIWPAEGLTFAAPSSICQDEQGAMWFGTCGATLLRWRDGAFTSFTPPIEQVVGLDLSVYPDAARRLYVGSVQNGLVTLENGKFNRPFPASDIGTVIRVLYRDRAGRIWIGSEFGLFCWEHDKLRRFSAEDGFTPAYANVLAITEDTAGSLWFGTAVGELRRYQHGVFTTYRPKDSSLDPLRERNPGTFSGGARFWALLADAEDVIWIGTLGCGLLRFQNGEFTRYTPREGLPNEHVCQILADGRGQLWLGTRGGIVRVSKESLNQFARGEAKSVSFVNYAKLDGLPAVECSDGIQPGCWRTREGRLWFATVKGAVWTDPADLPFNALPPPVVIEEISVDSERVAEGGQPSASLAPLTPAPLLIPAGRHYLDFKFTALSLTSPDKVRFKWKMAGLETDWAPESSRRSVSYSFLPSGDYEFQVQACNNDGVWNQTAASIKLTVLPYFWQTWWFRLAAGFLVAAILGVIYSVRIGRLRAMEKLRLSIARDLHDEVGANLASISLLAQGMEEQPSSDDAAEVRGIAIETTDTLRDIVWFIDPKHDRLSDLVTRLNETARIMLRHIPYHFEPSGDFASVKLPLAFRRNVPPIFKEALHNVLKHARATEVRIAVRRWEGKFQFRITDNGVGFVEMPSQAGDGLKNMRRRAADIKGQLEITRQPGGGTAVNLTAPIP